ncbi:hypothetical protein I305_06183 [Cryptococcus gattii E566]|uniref:Uncharacterized protein n=2 Tax=Cryptococcus gattii TaxID=37769 RepID=E6R1A4_CRYGW|nr:Hypothetical Protein CGB_B6730C [Cryptococcus gattii WM276]ADV20567.1 Hypothetical Protein CGB_B6730C [Cryptococcus gattii WM276]KIR76880.1 hypothetical protein I306_06137 [Cryptococcus gattii EJB2]KIY31279.1 hypothetical protein I305_06183 [Cryptococcus gattii E566]KJE01695.1 hypothetical protein I311_04733 [Cryptococcus gattii NT-10]
MGVLLINWHIQDSVDDMKEDTIQLRRQGGGKWVHVPLSKISHHTNMSAFWESERVDGNYNDPARTKERVLELCFFLDGTCAAGHSTSACFRLQFSLDENQPQALETNTLLTFNQASTKEREEPESPARYVREISSTPPSVCRMG